MKDQIKKVFSCQNCGAQFPKWSGRCLECGKWGSLKEELIDLKKEKNEDIISKISSADIIDLNKAEVIDSIRLKTSISEFDRVLGGGIVPGSVILLSGDPGAGKSTLLSQLVNNLFISNKELKESLYVSGEESAAQVKMRLERLKCDLKKFKFIGETNLEKIISSFIKEKPALLILDSIQTVYSSTVPGEVGGIGQIRTIAVRLMEVAKKYNIPVFLIGHVTKDGQIAGPKSLEHIVDVVLHLENDSRKSYSILRSTKNRFGSINEIGVLEMDSNGFKELKDPSISFLEGGSLSFFPGSTFSVVVEGNRPFLINVQALLSRTVFGYPQRKSSGFDLNRLQVLSAVISKKQKIDLSNQDIILNIVGGFKTNDPALDLAVSLAILSSFYDKALKSKTAVIGEIGLGGEIRPVSHLEIRLKEIEKMGFEKVVLADIFSVTEKKNIIKKFKNLNFCFFENLSEAVKEVFDK
jgi:DNA repair protein RadA/Sms